MNTLSLTPVILTGYKEHGKDECCSILESMGISSISSSWYACKAFMFDQLKKQFGYTTPEECYADRRNHRKIWFDGIRAYNEGKLSRMAEEIWFKEGYRVYNGLRNREEFDAIKAKFPNVIVIWVDASERKEKESAESMELSIEDAHMVIDNNGPLENLHDEVQAVFNVIFRN